MQPVPRHSVRQPEHSRSRIVSGGSCEVEHVGQARPRGSADGVEDEAGAEAGAEEKAGERPEEDVAERMKNNLVCLESCRGACAWPAGAGQQTDMPQASFAAASPATSCVARSARRHKTAAAAAAVSRICMRVCMYECMGSAAMSGLKDVMTRAERSCSSCL